jgi:hypothetical protein
VKHRRAEEFDVVAAKQIQPLQRLVEDGRRPMAKDRASALKTILTRAAEQVSALCSIRA